MARLVVGREALLLGAHYGLLALDASDHAVDGVGEVLVVDLGLAAAGGGERRFVADVGDVGSGEARGVLGYEVEVEVLREFQALEMDLEYLLALVEVGKGDVDLAVEASGAHQGLVKDVRAVGGGEDYDAGVGAEAVHFRKQLVEGVLALVVGGEADVLAAGAADGVDLVDEHDAGGLLLGLLEQVAHAGRTDSHEHFHEVGARDGEEGDVGLPRHGLGEQGLAGARRAYKQGSLRDLATEGGVFLGIL